MSVKIVAVAPTYNNAATLRAVLDGVAAQGFTAIVVDDGSTDATAQVLGSWDGDTVRHAVNRGKAHALRTGFARAAELGYTHALTIDTDGQHDPADLPIVATLCRENPDAIIVGARPRCAAYPRRSWWGRAASNALVRAIGGVAVSDSQSGLRAYPLAVVERLGSRTSRYAFETEVLARAGWANVPVVETPIRCIYEVPAGRVSHFRPWRDSASAAVMHAGMLTRSLWPASPRKLSPTTDDTTTGTAWERTVRWVNPFRTWRLIRRGDAQRERLAASVGWGAFMCFQPYFGMKTVMCLGLAKALRLQPLVVIGTSSLCTPPIGPVLWAMSITVGHWALRREPPHFDVHVGALALFREVAAEWLLGATVLGAVAGVVAYALAARAVRWTTRRWVRGDVESHELQHAVEAR